MDIPEMGAGWMEEAVAAADPQIEGMKGEGPDHMKTEAGIMRNDTEAAPGHLDDEITTIIMEGVVVAAVVFTEEEVEEEEEATTQ